MISRLLPVSFFSCLLLVFGCTKSPDHETYIGPRDITPPANFSVENDTLFPAYPLISFSENKQFFVAKFSHKVKWNLEIRGLQSGAIKNLEGISQILDSAGTTFAGDGEGVPFFLPGEICQAILRIPGHDRQYSTRFGINSTKTMDCFVLDDFESGSSLAGFTAWESDGGDSALIALRSQNQVFLQGRAASHFAGYDINKNYWIAYCETTNRNWTDYLTGKTADQLYINGFALGHEGGNTRIELQATEDEDGDGAFNSNTDEVYKKQVNLSDAWLGFSLLYADFEKAGSAGNNLKEPSKILKMRMVLISVPEGKFAGARVDFVNFTTGKPFSQR